MLVANPPPKPLLVFDGDCGFCRYWIARWRAKTGEAVDYLPYQDPRITEQFPEIPRERFARAVQLIEPDGQVSEGARAVFGSLARAGRAWPLWCYHHVPGFASFTELAYRGIADNRSVASWLTRVLWGSLQTESTYARSTWLFLRLIGVIYLVAFWSLATQIRGLSGADGILPVAEFMTGVRQWAEVNQIGLDRFRLVPTVFWLGASDAVLRAVCLGGAVLGGLLAAGFAPVILLSILWAGYLSLLTVCRPFLWYQWDLLLLETGFLAIFVAPLTWWDRPSRLAEPPHLARWLLLWLFFRLMFGSGIVKLASGDPTWQGLTALRFHYETQPLPTPLAWYVNLLPDWFHKATTAAVLSIELGVPWFIPAPRHGRLAAAGVLAGLQTGIWLTGNYTFFNLLALALCILLVDDAAFERMVPVGFKRSRVVFADSPKRKRLATPYAYLPSAVLLLVAIVTVPVSIVGLARQMGRNLPGAAITAPLASAIQPFESVNTYGLFAIMTTMRPEIIVEGSEDGNVWRPYEFKYKPGDLKQRPRWVAPHQPRLDWQMWFAALGSDDLQWFERFCQRLLEGSPEVVGLLADDPFAARPPRFVRGVLYQYHFADAATRRQQGVWWTREFVGPYSPVFSRDGKER